MGVERSWRPAEEQPLWRRRRQQLRALHRGGSQTQERRATTGKSSRMMRTSRRKPARPASLRSTENRCPRAAPRENTRAHRRAHAPKGPFLYHLAQAVGDGSGPGDGGRCSSSPSPPSCSGAAWLLGWCGRSARGRGVGRGQVRGSLGGGAAGKAGSSPAGLPFSLRPLPRGRAGRGARQAYRLHPGFPTRSCKCPQPVTVGPERVGNFFSLANLP